MNRYADRRQAGQQLALQLTSYANRPDVIVLGLPRGGVPVAYEVARALHVPLDVFIVRKLGVPGQPELAFGAMASGGMVFFNEDILRGFALPLSTIDQIKKKEEEELKRREQVYRGNRPLPVLKNKVVIIVDDGIATGATMKVAILSLRHFKPTSIIVAVPVASVSTCDELSSLADKIICPLKPPFFYAVGAWYEVFDQTTDAEVHELLSSGRLI